MKTSAAESDKSKSMWSWNKKERDNPLVEAAENAHLLTEELRAQYYDDMCAMDGRIMLAGEHASRIPAWQEGAVLSALDAIRRLHQRVVAA